MRMSVSVCSPVTHMKGGCYECALFECCEACGRTGKFKVHVHLALQSVDAENVSECSIMLDA